MIDSNRIEGAAAAASGPVLVNVLGYPFPALAALFSVAGVILASLIAPPPPRALSRGQTAALVTLLCILVVALAATDPHRSLVVSTCWAIGIGYTGLPLIQSIQERILRAVDLTDSSDTPDSGADTHDA